MVFWLEFAQPFLRQLNQQNSIIKHLFLNSFEYFTPPENLINLNNLDVFLLQVPIFGKLSLIMVDPRHADLKKLKVRKFQFFFHDSQKIKCPKKSALAIVIIQRRQ